MHNKKLFFLFVVLLLIYFASASEGCFVKVDINEILSSDSTSIQTSYVGIENLYGNYEGQVDIYNSEIPEMYILNTYDSENNLLDQYSFSTSLISYYDNFGDSLNLGGITISSKGQTSLVIPYDSRINRITLIFNGTEKELTGFNSTNLKCERTCKLENETGNTEKNDRCCEGLIKSTFEIGNFKCLTCGDGVCGENENSYNCFVDCGLPSNLTCGNGFIKTKFGCVQSGVCGNGILESEEECDDWNNIDVDGCSASCKLERCIQLDNSIFSLGNYFDNTCESSTQLREYYCGVDLFRLDFWNAFKEKIVKSKFVDCQYGCVGGACLSAPVNETQYCPDGTTGVYPNCVSIVVNQTIPPVNNTNQTLDLPSRPTPLKKV